MIQITIPKTEMWDESRQEFYYVHSCKLTLEHSLVSLSKWESRWEKPFLSKTKKTSEETLDYIRCMTLTQNVDPKVYACLTDEHISKIQNYIDSSMTATSFSRNKKESTSREPVTAELIYYWMIAFNVPFECQKWHLNRLMTLINVCSIKNQTPKKQSRKSIMSRNAALNAARRKRLNTRG